jgi:hypothetical protein
MVSMSFDLPFDDLTSDQLSIGYTFGISYLYTKDWRSETSHWAWSSGGDGEEFI